MSEQEQDEYGDYARMISFILVLSEVISILI